MLIVVNSMMFALYIAWCSLGMSQYMLCTDPPPSFVGDVEYCDLSEVEEGA